MFTREVFNQTHLCHGLSPELQERVYTLLQPNHFCRKVRKDCVAHHMGELFRHLIIVVKGAICSYSITAGGEQIMFYSTRAGETLGLTSYESNRRFRAEQIALEDTELVYIPLENYNLAMNTIPQFQSHVLKIICQQSERQNEIYILSRYKYARDRIIHFLHLEYLNSSCACVKLPFNMTDTAAYLGLTRSVFSHELHNLEREGYLSIERNMVSIKNPALFEGNITSEKG